MDEANARAKAERSFTSFSEFNASNGDFDVDILRSFSEFLTTPVVRDARGFTAGKIGI